MFWVVPPYDPYAQALAEHQKWINGTGKLYSNRFLRCTVTHHNKQDVCVKGLTVIKNFSLGACGLWNKEDWLSAHMKEIANDTVMTLCLKICLMFKCFLGILWSCVVLASCVRRYWLDIQIPTWIKGTSVVTRERFQDGQSQTFWFLCKMTRCVYFMLGNDC